ncbi:hypothetical protein [Sphingomonas lacusdianchii]|uniref:hypothetical protein n=1 Tax=Sphingomonas lacusdianchii TaxID=2917992 RepID=UPI001F55BCD7|nr:hypothetical protein [Sphingomonas sp. JXJ CY 53]
MSATGVLTFTNEAWFSHVTFGSNEPLWSLGFEIPYYLLFGLFLFVRGPLRIVAIVAWFAVFGPKIAIYLSLWLLGVATYNVVRCMTRQRLALGASLFVGSMLSYAALKFGPWRPAFIRIYLPETTGDLLGGAAYYFSISLLTALNIAGFALATRSTRSLPKPITTEIGWFANGSFTLYATHVPVMLAVAAIWPTVTQSRLDGTFAVLIVIAICYGLALIAERPKRVYKRHVSEWLGLVQSRENASTRA